MGAPVDGFIWSNGVMSTLTSVLDASGAAWSGLSIAGLSENGWIAGSGTINGATHAFIAKPAASVTSVGGGCGGAGMPVLGMTAPRIGQSVTLTLTQ